MNSPNACALGKACAWRVLIVTPERAQFWQTQSEPRGAKTSLPFPNGVRTTDVQQILLWHMREGEGEGEREQLGEFSKGLCLCEQAERGSVREDMSVPPTYRYRLRHRIELVIRLRKAKRAHRTHLSKATGPAGSRQAIGSLAEAAFLLLTHLPKTRFGQGLGEFGLHGDSGFNKAPSTKTRRSINTFALLPHPLPSLARAISIHSHHCQIKEPKKTTTTTTTTTATATTNHHPSPAQNFGLGYPRSSPTALLASG